MKRLLFTIAVCTALLVPSMALAAPGSSAGASASVAASAALAPEGVIEVQAWPGADAGQLVVIVSLRLPSSTPLPTRVRIPVPDKMVLDWSGEISADPAAGDLQRPFKLIKGANGTYAEFTVMGSRFAQAEFSGIPLVTKDGVSSGAFTFRQSVPSTTTSFSIRLLADTEPVSMNPPSKGPIDRNENGETLYTLLTKSMKLGDTQSVAVSYKPITPIEIPTGERSDPTVWLLLGLGLGVVVAAIVLAQVWSAQRRRTSSTEE